MTTCNCSLPGPCAACSSAVQTYIPTGWTTDYQRNALQPFAPEPHEHRWQAVAFLEDVRSVIQSCECGEARRVEVP